MDTTIKAAISGIIISFVILLFWTGSGYFLTYLIASIIVLYAFRIKEAKYGILVAFTIYLFTEWIVGTIIYSSMLAINENVNFTVDIWMVLSQIVTIPVILLGGLIGTELAKTRRTQTMFPSAYGPVPVPPPPISPTSTSAPVSTQEQKRFCRYCGFENTTDAIFCEKCGKKIG